MAEITSDIDKAVEALQNGKLVAIPTETVYGLAANALDKKAVLSIFEVKNRPSFDPLIVHTHSINEFEKYVLQLPDKALQLAEQFMPGPLTLVLPKKRNIPDIVSSGLPTVGIRIPNHPLCLQILKKLDFPLAAPSANPFGYVSPTTAEHVNAQLGHKIPLIIDGGDCRVGIESSIVSFKDNKAVILRLGGISKEEIEDCLGEKVESKLSSSKPEAPGMLLNHYAPNKKLSSMSVEKLLEHYPASKVGALHFSDYSPLLPIENQLILSKSKNVNEAAQQLFSHLRKLEYLPVDIVSVEMLPDINLGRAINDRLKRALGK